MKQLFLFFLFLLFWSQTLVAQQVKKDGKYSMQKRQEKMAMSSPGDVSDKTYSDLKNLSPLKGKTYAGRQEYKKQKPAYRTAKKSRKVAIRY
ncbi:MAG TPA: hypothetical protein PLD84_16265 [Chitinophagales bacterium]|nr:hypothetical protein [Chitinophagales bacterium]